jgi:hypothetical protein
VAAPPSTAGTVQEAGGMSRDHGRKMSIVMQRLLDPLCRRRALTILNA